MDESKEMTFRSKIKPKKKLFFALIIHQKVPIHSSESKRGEQSTQSKQDPKQNTGANNFSVDM